MAKLPPSGHRGQEFSLTLQQVLDMLGQGGRCYSGVPLNYKQIHDPWRLFIERLDNSIAYTVENCVLIAIEFNTSDQSRNCAVTVWNCPMVQGKGHVWGFKGWATECAPLTLACNRLIDPKGSQVRCTHLHDFLSADCI